MANQFGSFNNRFTGYTVSFPLGPNYQKQESRNHRGNNNGSQYPKPCGTSCGNRNQCNPCPCPSPCLQNSCCRQPPCLPCQYRIKPYFCEHKSFVVLNLTVTQTPNNYIAVGDQITYTYNITNNGNIPIRGCLLIYDTVFGCFTVGPPCGILPLGGVYNFTKIYTITQNDINTKSLTNLVTAYAQVCDNTLICSNNVNLVNSYGCSFLTGNITTISPVFGQIQTTVTITNGPNSTSDSSSISLVLPFPQYLGALQTNIVTPITATPAIVGTNSVTIGIPILPIGQTNTYTFTFSVLNTAPGTNYTWSGYLTSASCNRNPNNFLTGTYTF